MELEHWYAVVTEHAGSFLFSLTGALLLWLVGTRVIRFGQGVLRRSMERKHVDPTLVRYADSTLGVGLNILLFISVLSTLGVQTSTFAAVLAAAGIAIGNEIRSVIDRCYARARQILVENRDILDAMADALMKYETIDADQIDDLMARRALRPPRGWSDGGSSGGGAAIVTDAPESGDKPVPGAPAAV